MKWMDSKMNFFVVSFAGLMFPHSQSGLTVVQAIGWLLMHSLWQLAAVVFVAVLVDWGLRFSSASTRYAALLVALLLVAVVPIGTWWVLSSSAATAVAENRLLGTQEEAVTSAADEARFSGIGSNNNAFAAVAPAANVAAGKEMSQDDDRPRTAASPHLLKELWFRWKQAMIPWLNTVVSVWCAGVALCSIRPLWSWLVVRRLCTVGVSPMPEALQQVFQGVRRRLNVFRHVTLLQSTLVRGPVIVGCMRSVILMPAGFLSGIPVSQLESILAHELAHVRRYDYLVNVLQTLIETLFFYHPAVWWLSHRIRVERENCCDDLAVAVLGNKVEYGRALLAVEEYRCAASSSLALGVQGASLLTRVKRLFSTPASDDHRGVAGLMAASVVCLVAAATLIWSGMMYGADDNSLSSESHGLICRLVAVAPDITDDTSIAQNAVDRFDRSSDMTFVVELKNVSDQAIDLAGVRFGEGFAAETQGKLRTEFYAPLWFELEFDDAEGRPVARTHREYLERWQLGDNASVHQLQPGQTLKVVLRPATFLAPMNHRLSPGRYSLRVRYHGPDEEFKSQVRRHWPEKPILQAWGHEVVSNRVTFAIARPADNGRPEELMWGDPQEGLQAAIAYQVPDGVEGNPRQSPGVPVGTSLGVVFHIRNVSDQAIRFVSETGRQGDHVHVTNQQGEVVEVKDVWYSGWPIDVAWLLQPGETAELPVLAPAINSLDEPGAYTVRYTVRFNSRMQKDDAGTVVFPRPGDYDRELDTADTPLFLREVPREEGAHDEVSGTIVDETGQPVTGCEVSVPGAALVKTDEAGVFHYRLKRGSQMVLRALHPEYRTWHGALYGGEVVRIELQKKSKVEPIHGTRNLTVRLLDSRTAEPIPHVMVEAECWEGPKIYSVAASAVTNEQGTVEFRGLDFICYRLRQRADQLVPYVPTHRHTSADDTEDVVLLDRACELTLRAVDSESGEGVAGVEFHRERAAAEYWAAPIVPDILGGDRTERRTTVTDADGRFRCLVGHETWSYMIGRFPEGYSRIEPINGRQEVELDTSPGTKVEYTFRLVRS